MKLLQRLLLLLLVIAVVLVALLQLRIAPDHNRDQEDLGRSFASPTKIPPAAAVSNKEKLSVAERMKTPRNQSALKKVNAKTGDGNKKNIAKLRGNKKDKVC